MSLLKTAKIILSSVCALSLTTVSFHAGKLPPKDNDDNYVYMDILKPTNTEIATIAENLKKHEFKNDPVTKESIAKTISTWRDNFVILTYKKTGMVFSSNVPSTPEERSSFCAISRVDDFVKFINYFKRTSLTKNTLKDNNKREIEQLYKNIRTSGIYFLRGNWRSFIDSYNKQFNSLNVDGCMIDYFDALKERKKYVARAQKGWETRRRNLEEKNNKKIRLPKESSR